MTHPTSFILSELGKRPFTPEKPEDWERDYQKAMTITREIFELFEKHHVTPMEGYTIAASLADAIYVSLSELESKE